MSIASSNISKENSVKLQNLPGGYLQPLMGNIDLREIVMTYLNFQDSKSLTLVSKDFKVKVTQDSKDVFWKNFYIEHFGQQPPSQLPKGFDMLKFVEESHKDFLSLLLLPNMRVWRTGFTNNFLIDSVINDLLISYLDFSYFFDYTFKDSNFVFYTDRQKKSASIKVTCHHYNGQPKHEGTPTLSYDYLYNCSMINSISFNLRRKNNTIIYRDDKSTPDFKSLSSDSNSSKKVILYFKQHLERLEQGINYRLNVLIKRTVNANVEFLLKNINSKDLSTQCKNNLAFKFECAFRGIGILCHEKDRDFKVYVKNIRIDDKVIITYKKTETGQPFMVCSKTRQYADYALGYVIDNIFGRTAKVLTEQLFKTKFEQCDAAEMNFLEYMNNMFPLEYEVKVGQGCSLRYPDDPDSPDYLLEAAEVDFEEPRAPVEEEPINIDLDEDEIHED